MYFIIFDSNVFIMESKFKLREKVRIKRNILEPKYVGREGEIHKVYQSYSEAGEYTFVYRVNVEGRLIHGVACDADLEKI